MQTHTESSLLVGLRARDEHAYEQFVQRYGGRVFAVAQRLLRNEDDAQDAVQDQYRSARFLRFIKALAMLLAFPRRQGGGPSRLAHFSLKHLPKDLN